MYCDDSQGDIKLSGHDKQFEDGTNQMVSTKTMMTKMNSLLANQVRESGKTINTSEAKSRNCSKAAIVYVQEAFHRPEIQADEANDAIVDDASNNRHFDSLS